MQIPQKWSCGSFPQRRTLVRRWAPGRRQYRYGTARRKKGAVASTTTSEGIVGTTVGNFYIFASLVFVCICFYILNMFSFSPRPWDFTRICDRLTFMLWFGMRIFNGIVIHPSSQSVTQPARTAAPVESVCVCAGSADGGLYRDTARPEGCSSLHFRVNYHVNWMRCVATVHIVKPYLTVWLPLE